jgi:hypothetical protein
LAETLSGSGSACYGSAGINSTLLMLNPASTLAVQHHQSTSTRPIGESGKFFSCGLKICKMQFNGQLSSLSSFFSHSFNEGTYTVFSEEASA